MARRRLAERVPLRVRRAVVRRLPSGAWERLAPVVHGETSWQRRWRDRVASTAVARERRHVAGDGWVAVHGGTGHLLARVVDRFTAGDAFDGNLHAVVDALRAEQVPYWLVRGDVNRRRVVGVRGTDRARALEALASAGEDRALYAGAVRRRRVVSVGPVRDLGRRAGTTPTVLRVFEVLASSGGTLLAGPGYGCEVQFWEQDTAGTVVAPVPNRRAVRVPPSEQERVEVGCAGRLEPTFPALAARHALDVDVPVDVVYTWVDGSDPAWLERQRRAWSEVRPTTVNDYSANTSRYLSRDELRYSLRSLAAYAGWVRTVYLVTDDQVPPWLDTSHPKLRVVDHTELFGDTGRLPTFNSHAIESRLHRIDGLAEHYLYLNDDVFFGRPVSPELFFLGNGMSTFFLSKTHIGLGPPSAADLPVMSAAKNNRRLLEDAFGSVITHKLKHVPHPQQRSVLEEMEQRFPDEFARTAASQFRHPDDISIPSALFPYYAWFTRRAVPGTIRYYYADIGAPQTEARLRRLLRRRDFDTFCLNDHDSDHLEPEELERVITSFLADYFPLPCEFERG